MSLRELRENWDQVAASDPWRAILGRPGEGKQWDAREFFDSGLWEIDDVMRYAESLKLPARRHAALDFGCGAGRLTLGLARHFDSVTGVDVAPAMLALAREHNDQPDRCRYVLNDAPDLTQFSGGEFDLIYSNITLQHLRPRLVRTYLAEFVRVLAPEGLLLFHLPCRRLRPPLARLLPGNLYSYLSRLIWPLAHPGQPVIEMYGLPEETVVSHIERCGGRVLAREPQDSAGSDWESRRYAVTR